MFTVYSYDPRKSTTTRQDIRDVRRAQQNTAVARRQEAEEEFRNWYRNCKKTR